jgi:putative flippase GtrA
MIERLRQHRQLVTFLAVGISSVAIDAGLMKGLLLAGASIVVATSCGFVTGLAFNYTMHSRMTFSSAMSGATAVRYLIVVALGYLLNLACVTWTARAFDLPMVGKLIAVCVSATMTYVLGKRWIFR